jgi:hypothetical protein
MEKPFGKDGRYANLQEGISLYIQKEKGYWKTTGKMVRTVLSLEAVPSDIILAKLGRILCLSSPLPLLIAII